MAFDFASMLGGQGFGLGQQLPFAQLMQGGGMQPPTAAMLAGPGGMPTGAPPAMQTPQGAPTPEQIQQMMQARMGGMGAMMGGQAPGMGQGFGLGQQMPGMPQPTPEQLAGPGGMPNGAPPAPQQRGLPFEQMMKMGMGMMGMGQGQPPRQMMPGQLPVAGMGGGMAQARGGIGQGFTGMGGGVAPRRVVNQRGPVGGGY